MYPLCRFRPWLPTGCPFCGQSYPYDGVPRPFFGTEWPCPHSGLPSRMCARTFPCSGRGSCSLRTPRPRERAGASFFLELQDAIERVWEEWTPTADVRGMMHFGDRSQPLSVLPGQRANSARPDPRRECPSGVWPRSMEFFHGKMHTLPLEPSHDAGSVPQRDPTVG